MRERVGQAEEIFSKPANVETVGDLIQHLEQSDPKYQTIFKNRDLIRTAVNQSYVNLDHAIGDGDEIAFFPPVTGG